MKILTIQLDRFEDFLEVVESNRTEIALFSVALKKTESRARQVKHNVVPILELQAINGGYIYEFQTSDPQETPLDEMDIRTETPEEEGSHYNRVVQEAQEIQKRNADEIVHEMNEFDKLKKGRIDK